MLHASFVTYEEFGAVGDGKTDDQRAIVAAHAAANQRRQSVRATPGKTYYIGKGAATAVIKTDVDFTGAKFIIDDVGVANRGIPVFRVESDAKPVPVKGVASIPLGAQRLGITLASPALLIAVNDKERNYIRYGLNQNNGSPHREVFLVDAAGRICQRTPVTLPFNTVTSLTAYPIDKRPLVIRGGVFTTVANQWQSQYAYHNRGFSIHRSNVRVTGMTHLVTGELDHGAPYAGFLNIGTCANVTVENCVLTAHRTYKTIGSAGKPVSMGSYDISVSSAARISFINCRQTTNIHDRRYWGIFGSNFCKDLLFDRCTFSRFDAHMGVANATILNSTLGYMGINAIGFGTFRIENTTVCGGSFINLRNDYGCTWHGDFIIRNCTFKPRNPNRAAIISGNYNGKHNFGYPCHMPRRVIIDGLTIDDRRRKAKARPPAVFGNINPADRPGAPADPYPYHVTEELTLRNIKLTSGAQLRISDNAHMFRNTKVKRK